MAATNTLSTFTGRNRYFKSTLQQVLRNNMVSSAIMDVRYEEPTYTIQNPYSSQSTATISALTGTYNTSNWTTTNDALTITDQFVDGNDIYQFEKYLSNYDLLADRMDNIAYGVAYALDKWAVNNLLEDGTGTYSTPAGGFTTPSNIIPIMANLNSKVQGFQAGVLSAGTFLVIENTDMVGFEQVQPTVGYSTADSALRNGFYRFFMGVDIHVVRTGYFVTDTLGTKTVSNDGHRVYGVKKVATLATDGFTYEELKTRGQTGVHVRGLCHAGFKLWTQLASLIIDITIT